jgi:hypothetical protein
MRPLYPRETDTNRNVLWRWKIPSVLASAWYVSWHLLGWAPASQ